MVLFTLKMAKFIWILHLLRKYSYVSCASIVDLNIEPFSVLLEAKLVSEKIILTMEKYPDIDVVDHIKKLFDKKLEIEIGFHQKFDNILYNYYFRNNSFKVLIALSSELSNHIREKKVRSSEYINKILVQFSDVKNIDILNLSDLYLNEIPEAIYKFDNLRVLKLNGNDLADFEINSKCFSDLEKLSINYNYRLTTISESILNLTSLNYFSATGCSISKIPESIFKLKNLRKLYLCENPINELPKIFSKLEKLDDLFISNCKFEEFDINMSSTPEFFRIILTDNASLKYLKILISEIMPHSIYLDVKNCPLVNVEVYLNLKNTKFKIFDFSDKKLKEYDYVIMYNSTRLINSNRFSLPSNFQSFEYCLETDVSDLGKNIFIREFDPLIIKKNLISRDDLIVKWTNICEKYNLNTEDFFINDFKHSIAVLNNLYEFQINDISNFDFFIPFECKEKMITILSNLFDQLEEKGSEFQVKEILKLFNEHYFEQHIYFEYLLKTNKFDLSMKMNFLDFIKETIEILKDDLTLFSLNFSKYELEKQHKQGLEQLHILMEPYGNLITPTDSSKISTDDRGDTGSILKDLLHIVMNAKLKFDTLFTIDFISKMIYDLIKRIGNPKLFDYEIVHFLLDHCEIMPEYFEYETQSNTSVISSVSAKGIAVLINLIINGYTLSSHEN